MDKETQEVFSEGETVSDYIKTKAWKILKEKFQAKIDSLDKVRSVPVTDKDSLLNQILARQAAVEILEEFLAEVDGTAQQHESNRSLMHDVQII